MNEGAYIVDRIRARCEECGDCLLWTGYCFRNITPMINFSKKPTGVRRLMYIAAKGPVHPGWEVVGTCESVKCVNPDHMKQVSTADRRREVAGKRTGRLPVAAVQKIREKSGKLTMERARLIRSSEEPTAVLAERYGVSCALIGYVRRGISWAEPSPWSGLGAR